MLLDCFSIPCAMLFSCLFLGSRYRVLHLAGVALCVAGLCLTVLSDHIVPAKGSAQNEDRDTYPHAMLGDVFCLIGAALYAASNVMQEALVKAHDRAEFLGMLGAYGAALSFMQVGGLIGLMVSGSVRMESNLMHNFPTAQKPQTNTHRIMYRPSSSNGSARGSATRRRSRARRAFGCGTRCIRWGSRRAWR